MRIISGALILFLLASLPDTLLAAPRPATDADLAAMRAAGIPNPVAGMLWDPSDRNVGQAVSGAKQWLQQHSARHVPVQCFDPVFAQKLQNFMSAVPGGVPTITDGYRDPSKQVGLVRSGASKAGPCQSYHNYGLGADFNSNSRAQTAWMRANALRFGIRTIGAWDPNHFQDARGRFGRCGACSNTSGSGTVAGATGPTPTFGPPTSGGMPPPQQPPFSEGKPPSNEVRNNEPDPISNNLTESFDKPTQIPEENTLSEDTSSAEKLLEEIAGEEELQTLPKSSATNTPRVIVDSSDSARITSDNGSSTARAAPISVPAYIPSQTFISSDLAEKAPETPPPTLLSLQKSLASLMTLLRPFGIRDSLQGTASPSNEEYYLE